ncbi:restriction endonuclease subunit S [Chromobacterium haemolyticum]|uniref:Restriction endonuclease subunit S n=1 Tax=Chromobacterium haemolyticum TaxID=394935 RepID=A0ABS3GQB0_9NEIS|nr:restriction endonuclease subunit S [Chromobacterium haemolyticum]MBK0415816.1 restriction endonuclease subunit S [Chromobacterium haemolyticum]MBO0417235.1 restriction endonuclease subunit S [Chromobacterium haemolyticum]MBO0500315.1 restriction endonuclease subunit S [Chromobacterium haemolyticum]
MSIAGMPGYKETSIGWIPDSWPLRPLEAISTDNITYGVVQPGPEDESGVLLVRGGDVKNGRVSTTLRTISNAVSKQFSRTVLSGGELLVSLVGYPGETAIASKELAGANIARQVGLVRLCESNNSYFVQQYLSSPIGKKVLLGGMIGSAQQVINLNALREVEVPLPPLPEQQKIAAILTAVDDKLDVIARQIEATQTLKRGLMQTLFSRKQHTRWPVVPLHEVAEVRTGVAKGKKGMKEPAELPYLRVANVQDGHIDLSEVKTIEVEVAQIERYALQSGDVLMTEGGDFDKLGRGDVWEGQIAPCLHQNHVFAVRPNPEKLNSYYLAALAASDHGRQYFLSCAKRTTNLASINSSQLKALPVLLPPLSQQKHIASVVDAANARIGVLEAKRQHYQTVKRGLMQKLLTGEWRVKTE